MEIKTSKMMEKGTLKPLKITTGEYKKILNALHYSKYDDLTINNVLNNVTEYTAFVNNLTKLRNVNIYNISNADALDKIYRDHIKKRQDNIKNLLLGLKLPNIGKRRTYLLMMLKKLWMLGNCELMILEKRLECDTLRMQNYFQRRILSIHC